MSETEAPIQALGEQEPLPLQAQSRKHLPGAGFFRRRRLLVLAGLVLLVPLTLFSVRPFPSAAAGMTVGAWVVLACGLLLRGYAITHIAGAKGHKLVTRGPYAMCRHPLYLGSLLCGAGIVLLSQAPLCWAVFLLGGVGTYARTIRYEEQRLADGYPLAVGAYRAEVPMLVPRRLRLELPEVLPPGLPLLKETMTQAGFIAAGLAMELLVWLAGWIPLTPVLRLW